jgi:hypothetical protein
MHFKLAGPDFPSSSGTKLKDPRLSDSDISIITPENKTYTELMSGYYPATFGFENDENGSDPEKWDIDESGGTIQVLTSHQNHNKLVELHESSDAITSIYNSFDNRDNGTVECWVMVNREDDWFNLGLFNNTQWNGIHIGFSPGGTLRYYNGSNWLPITSYSANLWYHFRIEWNCLKDWHLWIDGISQDEGFGYTYNGSPLTLDRMRFTISDAGSHQNQYMYVDAVGYSWDPGYDIGDNLDEGLLLSFTPDNFDWMAYSLDNNSNRTISGNTTISMPEDGIHSIRVFGINSTGGFYEYESDIIYFKVDFPVDIITPYEKFYSKPMSGYYLGTFGFENDNNSYPPKEWIIDMDVGKIEIIPELDNHKKILRLYDDSSASPGGTTKVYNNFTKQNYGTIELWMQQDRLERDDGDRAQVSGWGNGRKLFLIRTLAGAPNTWQAESNENDVNITEADPPSEDIWYHIRIDFEHTAGNYQGLGENEYFVSIDGTRYGPYHFSNNESLEELHLHTYSFDWNYNIYFDAIGYSWDPDYNIGDNLDEGLLLSFTPDNFDWMKYSLNYQQNKTILGNTTIPFPNEGLHNIKVYGENLSTGFIYESNLKKFSVDSSPPHTSIHFSDIVNQSTTFELIATDSGGSGVDIIKYRINESSWVDFVEPFTLQGYSSGDYKISYYAMDNAGNEEDVNEIIVNLNIPKEDGEPPPTNPQIPGYSLVFLIGIIALVNLCLLNKISSKKPKN